MRHAYIIAKMTTVMIARRGTLFGAILAIVALSTLVFNVARSDGELLAELEIRINYSYAVTYSVLSLIIISIACFTIRSQIDAKNMHMVSSYPIKRRWILFGQALGVIFIAFILEIVLLSSLAANSWYFSKAYSVEEQELAQKNFFETRREVMPEYKSRREITLAYAEAEGIDAEKLDGTEWNLLFQEALREEQLVSTGKKRTWKFDLTEDISKTADLRVVYKFQQANKRQKVKGTFELSSKEYSTYFKQEIEADQYESNEFVIPSEFVPPDGIFTLTFTNLSSQSTVVTRSGLKCSYQKGSFVSNAFKVVFAQMVHLSVTAIVGLCAGVGLTFSVATFMVMMLFFMSIAEGVVQVMLEDFGFAAVITMWDQFIVGLMKAAMWVTKGLQPPSIVSDVSQGLDISWAYLMMSWFPATLFYGLVAAFIGVRILENKELDKIQT